MRANIEHAVLWTGRADIIGREGGAQVRPRITAIAATLQSKVTRCGVRKGRRAGHAASRSCAVAEVGGLNSARAKVVDGGGDRLENVVLDFGSTHARISRFDAGSHIVTGVVINQRCGH